MELTVVHPIKVRMPYGSQDFTPGEVIDLPDKVAQRLMELVPGKVRQVEPQLYPGVWIEFFSPLFGMCTARIHEVTVDGCVITDHSVLEGRRGTSDHSSVLGLWRLSGATGVMTDTVKGRAQLSEHPISWPKSTPS